MPVAGALMALRMFIVYVPLAYLGSRYMGIAGIFLAATAANIIAGGAAYIWLRRVLSGLGEYVPVAGRKYPAGASPAQETVSK